MALIRVKELAVEFPTCAGTPVEVCSLGLKVLIKWQRKDIFSSRSAKWDPTWASAAHCAYNGETMQNANPYLLSLRGYHFWLLELWDHNEWHSAFHIVVFCKNRSILQKYSPLIWPIFWASHTFESIIVWSWSFISHVLAICEYIWHSVIGKIKSLLFPENQVNHGESLTCFHIGFSLFHEVLYAF